LPVQTFGSIADFLMITEIMYHPPASGGIDADNFEFIELKNIGKLPVDLGGIFFSDGIQFVFPSETIMNPEEFIVLAQNSTAFESKYHFRPFATYLGNLDNGGERIAISDGVTNVTEVTYDDKHGWSLFADGPGLSLVPTCRNKKPPNPNSDPSDWKDSQLMGGSPGKDDGHSVVCTASTTGIGTSSSTSSWTTSQVGSTVTVTGAATWSSLTSGSQCTNCVQPEVTRSSTEGFQQQFILNLWLGTLIAVLLL